MSEAELNNFGCGTVRIVSIFFPGYIMVELASGYITRKYLKACTKEADLLKFSTKLFSLH